MSTEYPSTAIAATHPARLAAFGGLYRLRTGFDERFRMLELGCGDASNLLPLASRFPEAQFFGLDRDAEAIGRGEARRALAGLDNVRLLVSDVLDFDPEGETFDYVVAHGIYSWVPPEVQNRLLALCQSTLARGGVAYVSYNAYPGWGVRSVIRDLMCAAAASAEGDKARLRSAKSALSQLRRHAQRYQHPYSALLCAELDLVESKPAGYVLGEYLAAYNEPLYFRDFVKRAEGHGLRYLAESIAATPSGDLEIEAATDLVDTGISRLDAEQYVDVVSYRQFRATLLCHKSEPVTDAPDYRLVGDSGYFAAALTPMAREPLLGQGETLGFGTVTGAVIQAERPLLKAALLALSQAWPEGLRGPELVTAAIGELRRRALLESCPVGEAEVAAVMRELLALAERRLLEVLPWSPSRSTAIAERPSVSSITRSEAERGAMITGARHEPMSLDPMTRVLAALLDGSRDAQALARELRTFIDSGELTLDDPSAFARHDVLVAWVIAAVARMGQLGLLLPAPTSAA